MIHLTMQTGDAREIKQPSLAALDALRPLLADGGGDIGQIVPACAGVALRMCARPWTGAVSWDISAGGEPVTLCVLCLSEGDASSAWRAIEGVYLRLSDEHPELYSPGVAPAMPECFPWLATLLFPSAVLRMDVVGWVADFNQCVAAAVRKAVGRE